MKTIILPGHPFEKNKPDPAFEKEYESAKKFGRVFFFNLEEFAKNTEILTRLPCSENPKEDIFYHGWMMNSEQYRRFFLTLESKGYRLTNVPGHHTAYNYFTGWYPALEGLTPESVMIHDTEVRPVLDAALSLQKKTKSALIIKDAVKSLKHDWYKACFIPENANPFEMAKIIGTFLATKKEYNDLQLPVVIRKFEKLVSIGNHPKSGMPISHEYRTYVYKGKVLLQAPYWEVDYPEPQIKPDPYHPPSYHGKEPDPAFIRCLIKELMARCPSNLFTIDTALKENGWWTCIEAGDGQVSMLPDRANKDEFFSKLLGDNNEKE